MLVRVWELLWKKTQYFVIQIFWVLIKWFDYQVSNTRIQQIHLKPKLCELQFNFFWLTQIEKEIFKNSRALGTAFINKEKHRGIHELLPDWQILGNCFILNILFIISLHWALCHFCLLVAIVSLSNPRVGYWCLWEAGIKWWFPPGTPKREPSQLSSWVGSWAYKGLVHWIISWAER